jgi:hypothetical protein
MGAISKISRRKFQKSKSRVQALSHESARKISEVIKASYKAKYPKHHRDRDRKIEIRTKNFQLTHLTKNSMVPKHPKCGKLGDVYVPMDIRDHPSHRTPGYPSDFELFSQLMKSKRISYYQHKLPTNLYQYSLEDKWVNDENNKGFLHSICVINH